MSSHTKQLQGLLLTNSDNPSLVKAQEGDSHSQVYIISAMWDIFLGIYK